MSATPIKTEPIDIYLDPLTNREVCASCYDGHHDKCKSSQDGCRCLHHLSVKKCRPKKDTNAQQDMSSFGTIEVKA
jgi:hypothetical protein